MLVYSKKDLEEKQGVIFKAEYLHHFKESEELEDYHNPKIDFYFTPSTRKCFYEFSCWVGGNNTEDPIKYFESFFYGGIIKSKEEFLQELEKDKKFVPPGKKVKEFTRVIKAENEGEKDKLQKFEVNFYINNLRYFS